MITFFNTLVTKSHNKMCDNVINNKMMNKSVELLGLVTTCYLIEIKKLTLLLSTSIKPQITRTHENNHSKYESNNKLIVPSSELK